MRLSWALWLSSPAESRLPARMLDLHAAHLQGVLFSMEAISAVVHGHSGASSTGQKERQENSELPSIPNVCHCDKYIHPRENILAAP